MSSKPTTAPPLSAQIEAIMKRNKVRHAYHDSQKPGTQYSGAAYMRAIIDCACLLGAYIEIAEERDNLLTALAAVKAQNDDLIANNIRELMSKKENLRN